MQNNNFSLNKYKSEVVALEPHMTKAAIARHLINKYGTQEIPLHAEQLRKMISRELNKPEREMVDAVTTYHRVLAIGDIHEPFSLDGYLEFCKSVYDKYNCNTVVFIGDEIDNHFASYHEVSTKAMGANEEFEKVKDRLHKWYETFPNAYITIGNHHLVPRKAQTAGIPSQYLKTMNDVLEIPTTWKWVHEIIIDDVLYNHGLGGQAKTTALRRGLKTVQGHYHTSTYIEYYRKDLWAMQLPMGIDKTKYAFDYSKFDNKEILIGCAVVLNGQPIIELM